MRSCWLCKPLSNKGHDGNHDGNLIQGGVAYKIRVDYETSDNVTHRNRLRVYK